MNPLLELQAYLKYHAGVCRVRHWFGSLFHVGVEAQIVEDVAANERAQAARAYKAEQLALEAELALSEGDNRKAVRLLERAANLDHDISEALG